MLLSAVFSTFALHHLDISIIKNIAKLLYDLPSLKIHFYCKIIYQQKKSTSNLAKELLIPYM